MGRLLRCWMSVARAAPPFPSHLHTAPSYCPFSPWCHLGRGMESSRSASSTPEPSQAATRALSHWCTIQPWFHFLSSQLWCDFDKPVALKNQTFNSSAYSADICSYPEVFLRHLWIWGRDPQRWHQLAPVTCVLGVEPGASTTLWSWNFAAIPMLIEKAEAGYRRN